MKRRRWLVAALLVVGLAAYWGRDLPRQCWFLRRPPAPLREQEMRQRFEREHPGEKPLNWRIGEAALALHRTKPMGKFVLGLSWPDTGNDCSDFVACVVDEGLGAKARFKRHSNRHLVAQNPHYFESFSWDRRTPLLPGDALGVAHSPWYQPYPGACWHVGIVGSDGMVYDFVKLKRWSGPRYGRVRPEWFVRHCPRPQDISVTRLLPQYRYRLAEIAIPTDHPRPKPRAAPVAQDDTEG